MEPALDGGRNGSILVAVVVVLVLFVLCTSEGIYVFLMFSCSFFYMCVTVRVYLPVEIHFD